METSIKYAKLLKATQKWLEYSRQEDAAFSPIIADYAFESAKNTAKIVVEKLGLKEHTAVVFLTSWSEIILFAGFITGWLVANKKGFKDTYFITDNSPNSTDPPFTGALNFSKDSKIYAIDLTDKLFNLLQSVPAVLLSGFADHEIKLLKRCTEAALYSGFLNGAEYSYRNNSNIQVGPPGLNWSLLDEQIT